MLHILEMNCKHVCTYVKCWMIWLKEGGGSISEMQMWGGCETDQITMI